MAAPTPTMDQAISAVVNQIAAISPAVGIVLEHDENRDDDVEFLERYQDPTTKEIFLVLVSCSATDAEEGPASGEDYEIYRIRIRLITCMIDVDSWSFETLRRAQLIVNQLDKNSSVFRISGQIPLRTEEVVSMSGLDFRTFGEQKLYEATITLSVEARRWA